MEKKRGRAKKKVEGLRAAALAQAEGVQVLSPALSETSDAFYDSSLPPFNPGEFRDRSGSNLSNYSLGGSSNCINRLSPSFEDVGGQWNQPHQDFADILDMANNIRLGDSVSSQQHFLSQNSTVTVTEQKPPPPYQQVMANRFPPLCNGQIVGHPSPVKVEPGFLPSSCGQQHHQTFSVVVPNGSLPHQVPASSHTSIKQEISSNGTYQELHTTSMSQLQANPMLRDALEKVQQPHQFPGVAYGTGAPLHHYHGMGPGVPGMGINGQLPSDISDIQYDTYNSRDLQCDIDAVLRHEMNVAGKLDLDFNMDTYGST